jgi:hypothetical protein
MGNLGNFGNDLIKMSSLISLALFVFSFVFIGFIFTHTRKVTAGGAFKI